MIKISKQSVGENAAVYVVEDAPPEFDTFLRRARDECCGIYHKFQAGKYEGFTLKEAYYKDGKDAILEISKYLSSTYNPQYFNELKSALKLFIKNERKQYTLENVMEMQVILDKEIEEYEEHFGINISAEIENLDEETKNRIRDYILF